MQGYETYRERSRIFLEQAFAELDAGDLLQAAEKGWGAAAQILKAVAAQRGWAHGSHRLLFAIMGRLEDETQSRTLRYGFHAANTLHSNFYEGWMDTARVAFSLGRVREFVEEAESLLGGN